MRDRASRVKAFSTFSDVLADASRKGMLSSAASALARHGKTQHAKHAYTRQTNDHTFRQTAKPVELLLHQVTS